MSKEIAMKKMLLTFVFFALTGVSYAQDLELLRQSAQQLDLEEKSLAAEAQSERSAASAAQAAAKQAEAEEAAARQDVTAKTATWNDANKRHNDALNQHAAAFTKLKQAAGALAEAEGKVATAERERDKAIFAKVGALNVYESNMADDVAKKAYDDAAALAKEKDIALESTRTVAKGFSTGVDTQQAEVTRLQKILDDLDAVAIEAGKKKSAADELLTAKVAALKKANSDKAQAESKLKATEGLLAAAQLKLAKERSVVSNSDRIAALEKENQRLKNEKEELRKEFAAAQKAALEPIEKKLGAIEANQKVFADAANATAKSTAEAHKKIDAEVKQRDENDRKLVDAFNSQNEKLRKLVKTDEDIIKDIDSLRGDHQKTAKAVEELSERTSKIEVEFASFTKDYSAETEEDAKQYASLLTEISHLKAAGKPVAAKVQEAQQTKQRTNSPFGSHRVYYNGPKQCFGMRCR